MEIIIAIIVGGLAGWIASLIVGDSARLGILGNIVVGFIGAVLGNFLLGGLFNTNIQLSHPTWGGFALAIAGAVILLFVVNLISRRQNQ